jgi:hypothetical protein
VAGNCLMQSRGGPVVARGARRSVGGGHAFRALQRNGFARSCKPI